MPTSQNAHSRVISSYKAITVSSQPSPRQLTWSREPVSHSFSLIIAKRKNMASCEARKHTRIGKELNIHASRGCELLP